MFKRTWQVVFWGTRNISGAPKLLVEILPPKSAKNKKNFFKEMFRHSKKKKYFCV